MNKFTARLVLCLAVLILGLAAGVSANVSVRFCFTLDTVYTDYADGDYWTLGYNVPAYGIHAKVFDNSTPDSPLWNAFATNGSGCTSYLSMDTSHSYTIKLWSESKDDNNNTVHVYQGYSGATLYTQIVDSDYRPTVAATEYYTYEVIAGWEHETNILAAAGFALREHPAGLSGKTFNLYGHTPDGGGAYAAGAVVYLNQKAKDWKTGTTHELGHVVGYFRNGSLGASLDYSDIGDANCDSSATGHEIDSRELQTAAAVEGIAHFYAAVIWNDETESDCEFRFDDCFWDADFQIDWLSQCQGTQLWRGNEMDWLRFWWHLHYYEPVSVATIYSIWDDANPNNWMASNVYKRLRDAAASNGVSNSTWDGWGALNGVNHGIWP